MVRHVGCSVCGKDQLEARGLCQKHYMQWWMTARGRKGLAARVTWDGPDPPVERAPKGSRADCEFVEPDGTRCDRPHASKGLCMKHYKRLWQRKHADRINEKQRANNWGRPRRESE